MANFRAMVYSLEMMSALLALHFSSTGKTGMIVAVAVIATLVGRIIWLLKYGE